MKGIGLGIYIIIIILHISRGVDLGSEIPPLFSSCYTGDLESDLCVY